MTGRRIPLAQWRPGGAAAVALALWGAALAGYLGAVQPARQRLDDARARLQALERRAPRAGGPQAPDTPAAQLAAFYRLFPGEHEAADAVGRIAAVAQRSGLALDQADYKVEREKVLRLTRLQMNLPLRADYKALRRFIAELRADLPGVALEQVRFERRHVGDRDVEARLRLVIFLARPA